MLLFSCCVTNCHKCSRLKHHTFISTQLCRPEVWAILTGLPLQGLTGFRCHPNQGCVHGGESKPTSSQLWVCSLSSQGYGQGLVLLRESNLCFLRGPSIFKVLLTVGITLTPSLKTLCFEGLV